MSEYRKVQPGEPMYDIIEAAKQGGQWICDAVDHNDPKGCSNPKCFKYWQGFRRISGLGYIRLIDKRGEIK